MTFTKSLNCFYPTALTVRLWLVASIKVHAPHARPGLPVQSVRGTSCQVLFKSLAFCACPGPNWVWGRSFVFFRNHQLLWSTSLFQNLADFSLHKSWAELSIFSCLECVSSRKQHRVCDLLQPSCRPPVVRMPGFLLTSHLCCGFITMKGLVTVLPSGPDRKI